MKIKRLKKIKRSILSAADYCRGGCIDTFNNLTKAAESIEDAIQSAEKYSLREKPEPKSIQSLLQGESK